MSENTAVPTQQEPDVTCLRFPELLDVVLGKLHQLELVTLRDVFGPRLNMTDEQLLRTAVLPEECQLRTTVFLIRKRYQLHEVHQGDLVARQLVLGVAQECVPYQYKGRRS